VGTEIEPDGRCKRIKVRAIGRRLCSFVVALVLVAITVLLAVLWIKSYTWQDVLQHSFNDGRVETLQSDAGEWQLVLAIEANPMELPHWSHFAAFPTPFFDEKFGVSASRWIPLKWGTWSSEFYAHSLGIFVPMWVPMMICCLLTSVLIRRALRNTPASCP
jgi:hypothetical protein